jgi:hypothetical protein
MWIGEWGYNFSRLNPENPERRKKYAKVGVQKSRDD